MKTILTTSLLSVFLFLNSCKEKITPIQKETEATTPATVIEPREIQLPPNISMSVGIVKKNDFTSADISTVIHVILKEGKPRHGSYEYLVGKYSFIAEASDSTLFHIKYENMAIPVRAGRINMPYEINHRISVQFEQTIKAMLLEAHKTSLILLPKAGGFFYVPFKSMVQRPSPPLPVLLFPHGCG